MYIDLTYITAILETKAPRVARLLGEMARRVNDLPQEEWHAYYHLYFRGFESIITSLNGTGTITPECYLGIQSCRDNAEKLLRDKFAVEAGQIVGPDRATLKALHYLGLLRWYVEDNSVTFALSPTLAAPVLGYISAMNADALERHVLSIARLRHAALTDGEAESVVATAMAHVRTFMSAFREALETEAKELLELDISTEQLAKIATIEILPTSTEFYQAGIRYYNTPWMGRVPEHFTFATTSGVILPEEHFGSRYFKEVLGVPSLGGDRDNNPIRKHYFDVVRTAQTTRRRHYYFEKARTAAQLQKTHAALLKIDEEKAAIYLRHATEILASYLDSPNFALYGVDVFPAPFDKLTLGNSNNVILSVRDKTRTIAHGMWLRPRPVDCVDLLKEVEADQAFLSLLVGVGFGGVSAMMVQSLAPAFLGAFAGPIFYGLLKVRGRGAAKQSVFDLAARIGREPVGIRPFKCLNKQADITPQQLVDNLLNLTPIPS